MGQILGFERATKISNYLSHGDGGVGRGVERCIMWELGREGVHLWAVADLSKA